MRRQSLVAGVVLTATLATLVALPGAAGSQTSSSVRPYSADAFQTVRLPAFDDGSPVAIRLIDAGYESAGHLDDTTPLIEPGAYAPPTERSTVALPAPALRTVSPPSPKRAAAPKTTTAKRVTPKTATAAPAYRRVLTGLASWYDNGTTAMRLPHGTHIRICGARSCVTTVVRDWGPAAYLSERVVDMTPRDFVRVTGKSLGAGLAPVKVYIY